MATWIVVGFWYCCGGQLAHKYTYQNWEFHSKAACQARAYKVSLLWNGRGQRDYRYPGGVGYHWAECYQPTG